MYNIHHLSNPSKIATKKIVRIITNSDYLAHSSPLFKETKLLKLDDITKLEIATLMYKNRNEMRNLLPSHNYSTRHCDNLSFPIHRLSKFQHSTTYLGPVIWNSIPTQIQDAPSIHTFKSRLKTIS